MSKNLGEAERHPDLVRLAELDGGGALNDDLLRFDSATGKWGPSSAGAPPGVGGSGTTFQLAVWTGVSTIGAADALTNGQLHVGQTGAAPAARTISGDATLAASGALTLANTGVVAGNYGSATEVAKFTVDSKGRLTTAAVQPVAIPASQITSGTLAVIRGGTGLDASAAANGTLLIGNGSGFTLATLTQGANVTITNGPGTITIAASAGGVTDHGALTGLLDDDHSQYLLLAGRAGTANNLTLSLDGTGILRGSAAVAGGLDLVATTNAADGAIRFFSDPTTERARFLSTGEFVVGATTLTAFSEIVRFNRDQNAPSRVTVTNPNGGASSMSQFLLDQGTDASRVVGAIYAASTLNLALPFLTGGVGFVADPTTGAGTANLHLRTTGAIPIIFVTNEVERVRILSTGELQGNAGFTIRGGAGVHTLTLVGGAGVASTLRLGLVAGDLIGFHGTAAVAQHSSTGQTAGFTQGVGLSVLDDSTFTGGTGATAYTVGDVVRALKQKGLMAA